MSSAEGEATFYALPEAEQVRGLERLATEALRAWDLQGAKLTPAAYRENMTFRVDAGDRGRFALRIHQAGYRSDDEIRSELAFMTALREGGVRTPEVVAARDGSPFVRVRDRAVPEERQCDLFEWIDGRLLRSVDDTSLASSDLEAVYTEVGRQAASIANFAEAWQRVYVDLVCGLRDFRGQPFELHRYRDPDSGMISEKSHQGRLLKALELPGLWNGSMTFWNTLFVEVPPLTFNPVKTILDLLRPPHQPEEASV